MPRILVVIVLEASEKEPPLGSSFFFLGSFYLVSIPFFFFSWLFNGLLIHSVCDACSCHI